MPTRRTFLKHSILGASATAIARSLPVAPLRLPHFPPRARRIVFLIMSGGPSQQDLFDHKPLLAKYHGQDLPASVLGDQRLTGMSGNQARLPIARSLFGFHQHGQSGAWVSELLPHTARAVDELCIVRSMCTDAINHDPAITFLLTGSPLAGRPAIAAWLSYGLPSANKDLPDAVVLITRNKGGQPLYSRLWGAGFLPAQHQGVAFWGGKDPVLFLRDPDGISQELRARMVAGLDELHAESFAREGDPAILDRAAQANLALRMQASIPEAANLSEESPETLRLYGPGAETPGTFAANCVLARRLLERDVRCVQLFHQGWDQHGDLPRALKTQCQETDQASAALVWDLKRRGLLDDTLVVWGGEFGRTTYCQGRLTATDYGRDHHPRCFTMWLAGAGVRAGSTYGATDDLGYNVSENPVHVHDLHATLLHLMGLDHKRLTYMYQGRKFRLTDVHGRVVSGLLG